jgi:hypothetical protein
MNMSSTRLSTLLPILTILSFTAEARAECPEGLPSAVLLEWRVTLEPGGVGRFFEVLSHVGPRNGRAAWHSVIRDEDGRTVLAAEYVCVDGNLITTVEQNLVTRSRWEHNPGFPYFLFPSAVSQTLDQGQTRIVDIDNPEIEATLPFIATTAARAFEDLTVPAGLFRAYPIEHTYRMYYPDGSLRTEQRTMRWFAIGADLIPLRWDMSISSPGLGNAAMYFELVSYRHLRSGEVDTAFQP